MIGTIYRKWIEAGFKNYGKDPWFFIRELAQNSRDAGAQEIHVKAGRTTDNKEIIVFEDDGIGMTYSHACQYLFRLYASSKTNDKYSAGMFGIGFWTILKFNPDKIIIESVCKKEKWAVTVDAQLNTSLTSCRLKTNGTRITLLRTPVEKDALHFIKKTDDALKRYCRYLCRNTRQGEPLPVFFQDQNIARPMKLPGPITMHFKKGAIEGVVGMAANPKVHLYSRGLPVWEGNTLEELSHTPPTVIKNREIGQGLAPVFLINGNNLKINMSRRQPIDNRALDKLQKTADSALAHLVEMVADCVSPRTFFKRLIDNIKKFIASVFTSFWKALIFLLILIIPLEYVILTKILPRGKTEDNTFISMKTSHNRYSGASVSPVASKRRVRLRYSPPGTTWFKLFHVHRYDPVKGFNQAHENRTQIPFLPVDDGNAGVNVELETGEKGEIILPCPIGHHLLPGSVTHDFRPTTGAVYYSSGETAVTIPTAGVIRYICVPLPPGELPGIAGNLEFIDLPSGLIIPRSLETILENARSQPVRKRVAIARQLTASLLIYDDSAQTAQKYHQHENLEWLQKVLAVGAGDCDIVNGVTVLFLRKMGLPSRLVIGLVGDKGQILPGLHAWAEYYSNGWQPLDSTYATPSIHAVEDRIPYPVNSGMENRHYDNVHTDMDASLPLDTATVERVKRTVQPPPTEADTAIKSSNEGSIISIPSRLKSISLKSTSRKWLVVILIASAMVLCLLLILLYFHMNRRTMPPVTARHIQRFRESLAEMALHALLHPGAWGNAGNIRNYKFIPTISGSPVSLRKALIIGQKGKLFYVKPENPIVAHLKKASMPILESGQAAFDALIKLIPGGIDLDQITGLQAAMPDISEGSGNEAVKGLTAAVNGLIDIPCLPAPGLSGDDFFDVDLAVLPSLKGFGIPNRFIAVNPGSEKIRPLVSLYNENPPLACFRFIRMLPTESGLMEGPAEKIIKDVSKRLIKEFS